MKGRYEGLFPSPETKEKGWQKIDLFGRMKNDWHKMVNVVKHYALQFAPLHFFIDYY